mgnify:CR=1 FL=1
MNLPPVHKARMMSLASRKTESFEGLFRTAACTAANVSCDAIPWGSNWKEIMRISRNRDWVYLFQQEYRECWIERKHPYRTPSDWMSLQVLRTIVDSTTCRCILEPPFVRRAKIVSWHLLRRSAHRNHEALLQVCVCVVCVVCGRGRRTRSVVQISSQSCSRVDKCGW